MSLDLVMTLLNVGRYHVPISSHSVILSSIKIKVASAQHLDVLVEDWKWFTRIVINAGIAYGLSQIS